MKNSLLLFFSLLLSCDSKPEPEPTVTPTPIDPATSATIRGIVVFKGTPPPNPKLPVGGSSECSALHSGPAFDEIVLVKDGRLQNVFVYVKEGLEKYVFDWPRMPVTVTNQKCIYVPRVAGVQVNQPIQFANDDPTLHNIHGFLSNDQFNFSLFSKGSTNDRKIRSPEVMVKLKCDIHPWMIGYVGVLPHPFFAVTGETGTFEFKGLPPGDYVLEAWHEKYEPQTRKAKVDPKGSIEVEFTYPGK
jgi:hypothetical protein